MKPLMNADGRRYPMGVNRRLLVSRAQRPLRTAFHRGFAGCGPVVNGGYPRFAEAPDEIIMADPPVAAALSR